MYGAYLWFYSNRTLTLCTLMCTYVLYGLKFDKENIIYYDLLVVLLFIVVMCDTADTLYLYLYLNPVQSRYDTVS